MALSDALLKQLSKKTTTTTDGEEAPVNPLKNRAALIISVFAAVYSICVFFQGQLASTILNNTIKANDTWAFYQAKSIKQTLAEMAMDDAIDRKDMNKAKALKEKIDRYESDPATGEGKRELMMKAHKLESDRDIAKMKAPWIGIAGSVMQIAIVLLTASMLTTGMMMFWGGLIAQIVAMVLMSQGLLLWLPI